MFLLVLGLTWLCWHWQALRERKNMELKQGENILHTALETALDYKVGTVENLPCVLVVGLVLL